ncbi:MAG: hypothetical protein HY344_04040 [Candidatus Levybacteria bacterium]|nr:hypothetical protein [Candidatus Levybacteria bacterium]
MSKENQAGNKSRLQRLFRRFKPAAKAAGTGLLAAEIMGAGAVANAATPDKQPQAIVVEGQMPSLQSVVVFPGEKSSMQTQPEASANWVNPRRIESVEEAAKRFGMDDYSKNPNNWFLNEWGGATLKPDQNDVTHRVKANSAVIEAWIRIRKAGPHQAQTLVVNPKDVDGIDVNGGTWWDFAPQDAQDGWAQVREQVKAKEKIEQPDVDVVPVCTPVKEPVRPFETKRIKSRVYAANTYGRDKYSRDPRNWKLNRDGSATLRPDSSGLEHEVTTGKAVLDGWNGINRPDGEIDAAGFVAMQVNELYVRGMTVYEPENVMQDRNPLFRKLLKDKIANEARTQPGVLVNPFCN